MALACGALLIYVVGRGTTFFYDEWNFILERRTGGLDAFFRPHGGHWSTIPVAVYRVLFAVVGLRHYGVYRAVLIAFHLACCILFYLVARRRIGELLALLPTILLIFLGSAWQDILWPFQIGYLGSIGAGLASLLALDARSRRGDLLAAIALLVSMASSGLGIPFALAALVEVLLLRAWRRLWVAVVPLACFGIWYLTYGRGASGAAISNLGHLPSYVMRSALAAAAGIAGATGRWQNLVGLAGLALVAVALIAGRRLTPRLLMLLSIPLVFWGLAALTRAQIDEPAASRYLYPGAIFLLLIAVEVLSSFRLPVWSLAVGILLLPAIAANIHLLQNGAQGLIAVSTSVRAELGAVEIARGFIPRDLRPDPAFMPQVTVGPYLDAVDALGSPADPPRVIGQQPDSVRLAVDALLVRGERLQLSSYGTPGAPAPVTVYRSDGASVSAVGDCELASAPASGTAIEVVPRPGWLRIEAAGAVALIYLRRFADEFPDPPLGMVAPESPASLGPGQIRWIALPADGAGNPWTVEIFTRGAVTLCAFGP